MTPVETLINAFGTVGKTAKALGLEKTMISRWKHYQNVPNRHQQRILLVAWKHGVNITPYELIFGKEG